MLSSQVLEQLELDEVLPLSVVICSVIQNYYTKKKIKKVKKLLFFDLINQRDQNVNKNTLRKNVERKFKKTNLNHGNCRLTSDEELRIVGYLRAFDLNGQGLTRAQTQTLVRKLHFSKNDNWDSNNWVKNFQKRYVILYIFLH